MIKIDDLFIGLFIIGLAIGTILGMPMILIGCDPNYTGACPIKHPYTVYSTGCIVKEHTCRYNHDYWQCYDVIKYYNNKPINGSMYCRHFIGSNIDDYDVAKDIANNCSIGTEKKINRANSSCTNPESDKNIFWAGFICMIIAGTCISIALFILILYHNHFYTNIVAELKKHDELYEHKMNMNIDHNDVSC